MTLPAPMDAPPLRSAVGDWALMVAGPCVWDHSATSPSHSTVRQPLKTWLLFPDIVIWSEPAFYCFLFTIPWSNVALLISATLIDRLIGWMDGGMLQASNRQSDWVLQDGRCKGCFCKLHHIFCIATEDFWGFPLYTNSSRPVTSSCSRDADSDLAAFLYVCMQMKLCSCMWYLNGI